MTRVDRARYLGILAACLLAASGFAPMITVPLRAGTHWQPFGPEVRLLCIALAVCAALASLGRAFWIAAYVGAFGFANGLLLLGITYGGLINEHVQAWAHVGWGFVPLLSAGLALVALPFWVRAERVDRPSA